jgi:hypothetical protein
MRKINLKVALAFLFFFNFIFLNLYSQINNRIVVKVGKLVVTSLDVQNEIITNLIISKQEITQENVNKNKKYAVKNLVNKSIKKGEIDKYQVSDYNKKDLQNYLESIAKKLNTNRNGLKKIFDQNNIDYQTLVENYKIELSWNSLIFEIYQNQTNINMVEVDNEVENFKKDKSKEEIEKIKKNILNKKKEEKLQLFSRSHFSNLENTIIVNFQ